MNLTTQQLAKILECPESNVTAYWPLMDKAFEALCPNYTDDVAIAVLATVRVETGSRVAAQIFSPIKEEGSFNYFVQHYWDNLHVREMLGNQSDVDAIRYIGRGFVQISGRSNYAHFGQEIGVNLLDHPDEALEPNTAALILAVFFKERGCVTAANAKDWELVRKHVNGGTNGLDQFKLYISRLQAAIGTP